MSELEGVKRLNPWLYIWVKPRETMKQVFELKPGMIHTLILLGVLVEALDQLALNSTGDAIQLPGLVGGVVGYVLFMYLFNYFLIAPIWTWLGKKLGGVGTLERVRYALAYSYIPYVYSLVIVWIPSLILFKMENFTMTTPIIDGSTPLTVAFILLGLIDVVIAVWFFFISLKTLGEAHGFSAWKALGTMLIPAVIVAIFVFVVVMFFGVASIFL